jgi:type IV secretory pathway VirB3-like protein
MAFLTMIKDSRLRPAQQLGILARRKEMEMMVMMMVMMMMITLSMIMKLMIKMTSTHILAVIHCLHNNQFLSMLGILYDSCGGIMIQSWDMIWCRRAPHRLE